MDSQPFSRGYGWDALLEKQPSCYNDAIAKNQKQQLYSGLQAFDLPSIKDNQYKRLKMLTG